MMVPVFATRDWHPPDHCSFRAQGGDWPEHCVAGTPGAQFSAVLDLPADTQVISKATLGDTDSYSGFSGTDLHQQLQRLGVRRLFVGGLATDYCVRHTVLDARRLGYGVILLLGAMRPVDVRIGDARFPGADLTGAVLNGSDLSGCDFSDAKMRGVST